MDPLVGISATNVLVKVTALRVSPQQVLINPSRDEPVLVDRTVLELQFQYGRLGIMTSRPQCCRLYKRALHRYLLIDKEGWQGSRLLR